MKHRSTAPSLIIGFGLISVLVFAFGVKWTGSSPIIRLRPELERQFGVRGFRCWLKVEERRIEVRPPEAAPRDRAFRRQIAADALLKYLDLCKSDTGMVNTVVESVVVLAPKGTTLAPEEVDRATAETTREARAGAEDLVQAAAVAAGTSASVAAVGPALHGASLVVRPLPGATLGESEARRLAQTIVARSHQVSFVRVERGDGGAYEAGQDVAALGSGTGAPLVPGSGPR